MFKIKISNELITHCQDQVEKHNFGMRRIANGTQERQLTGIIGQSAIMELFGLGYVDGDAGFDNGVDIEYNHKKIDVKTMGRTTDVRPDYTNNFLKLQDCFNPDIYLFCSYNKNTQELTVCGWISKDDFIEKRKFYPRGSIRTRTDGSSFRTFADLFEIDVVDLNDTTSFEDLKKQLNN